ncbi:MAG: hypothetical protein BMS9Abin02_0988 [Anaerolineae bacterium]|nr:MAG: hypothetical protein BMS9Abin02_0988 [Anaerolineae bacterium]
MSKEFFTNRRQLTKYTLFSVIIIALLWAVWTAIVVRDRPATIADVSGSVFFSPANSSQWETARIGQVLYRGDQLLTNSPDGGVLVIFNDGNIAFRLEDDSLVTLNARWNHVLQRGSGGLFLSQGTLRAETQGGVSENYTRMRIDTPTAWADIQGTRLIVQVLNEQLATLVSSLSGEVHIKAKPDQAVLYMDDANPVKSKDFTISDNETMIVYVDSGSQPSLSLSNHQGRVKDRITGKGVGNVLVNVVGDPALFAETNKDGYFEISSSAANGELIIAGATSQVSGDLELITQVGQVRGQVLDFFNYKGVKDIKVFPLGNPALTTSTGSDGNFVIQELPVGAHTLILSGGGYLPTIAEVTISQGVHHALGQIRLVPLDSELNFLPIIINDFRQYP